MNPIIDTNITNTNIILNNMITQKICKLLKYDLVEDKSEMYVQNVKNKSKVQTYCEIRMILYKMETT